MSAMIPAAGSAVSLFTMEFVLSIGGRDDPDTRDMLHVLNIATSVWGQQTTMYMVKFLNLVKTRTDELSVTLQTSETPAKSRDTEISQRLKESESKLALAQKEIKEQKTKYSELSHKLTGINGKSFDMLLKTFNKKCIEMDSLRDESVRQSIWFAEQNSLFISNKTKMEHIIIEKEKQIKEIKGVDILRKDSANAKSFQPLSMVSILFLYIISGAFSVMFCMNGDGCRKLC